MHVHTVRSIIAPIRKGENKGTLSTCSNESLRACLNNRYRAIFGHFQEVLSCFYCCLLRTCGIPIALVIHSFDPTLGLKFTRFWRFYTPSAPLGLLEAGAQCAPYKCTFQTGSKAAVTIALFAYWL